MFNSDYEKTPWCVLLVSCVYQYLQDKVRVCLHRGLNVKMELTAGQDRRAVCACECVW